MKCFTGVRDGRKIHAYKHTELRSSKIETGRQDGREGGRDRQKQKKRPGWHQKETERYS